MSHNIVVIPFPHPGHLFPAVELCNRLATSDYQITLFYPSSSSPSLLSLNPLIQIVQYPLSSSIHFHPQILESALTDQIAAHFAQALPKCVIVDEMTGWLINRISGEYNIPAVSFFTSSAASSALGLAMKSLSASDLTRGETRTVPGLPVEMALTPSLFEGAHRGPPKHHRGIGGSESAVAFLFNTCADLEDAFLNYIAEAKDKPVFGVGPLLPDRESDVGGEEDVIGWLDLKPRGSVIYVAFGSLVSPSEEELTELAAGLEESNRPYIWVVRADADVADSVGENGLVIRGWAPQMRILRHASTGGYLCHCGWNSTVEAMICGVPMLTWPIRGDQHINAKMVTSLLKIGVVVREGEVEVKKNDVVNGIKKLMGDEGFRKRAAEVKCVFSGGFPKTSQLGINSFLDFVGKMW